MGVQLVLRSDVCTSRAKALSSGSLAKASLAQEANIEESIATNRGRTRSIRIFVGRSIFLFRHSLSECRRIEVRLS